MPAKKKSNPKSTKTVRGALIKGMSKKIPATLLHSPVFREKLKELMKGYAGIYALYDDKQLYYVGLTRDLFTRVRNHLKDRHKDQWDYFVIFRIRRVRLLKDIETLIIHIADLPGNRAKGRIPQDEDINKILHGMLRDLDKEMRGIRKALGRK